MAEFTGITAARAEEILGLSVVSGEVNASGRLIFTRSNGTTFDGGDFVGIVSDVMADTVDAEIAATLPAVVAGKVVDKGDISGAVKFTEFNNTNLVNAMIKAKLIGNITIAAADLPAGPRPNTQFAMRLTQDATGSRTITLTGIKKSMGTLALTKTANSTDMLVFIFDGTTWYAGAMGLAFS